MKNRALVGVLSLIAFLPVAPQAMAGGKASLTGPHPQNESKKELGEITSAHDAETQLRVITSARDAETQLNQEFREKALIAREVSRDQSIPKDLEQFYLPNLYHLLLKSFTQIIPSTKQEFYLVPTGTVVSAKAGPGWQDQGGRIWIPLQNSDHTLKPVTWIQANDQCKELGLKLPGIHQLNVLIKKLGLKKITNGPVPLFFSNLDGNTRLGKLAVWSSDSFLGFNGHHVYVLKTVKGQRNAYDDRLVGVALCVYEN